MRKGRTVTPPGSLPAAPLRSCSVVKEDPAEAHALAARLLVLVCSASRDTVSEYDSQLFKGSTPTGRSAVSRLFCLAVAQRCGVFTVFVSSLANYSRAFIRAGFCGLFRLDQKKVWDDPDR